MDRYLWKVIYKMAFVIYENRKSRNLEFSQCEEGREIFFQATLLPWGLSDHLACGVTKVHPHPSGDAELGRELRRTQNLTDFNAVKTSAVKWKQRVRGRKTETESSLWQGRAKSVPFVPSNAASVTQNFHLPLKESGRLIHQTGLG